MRIDDPAAPRLRLTSNIRRDSDMSSSIPPTQPPPGPPPPGPPPGFLQSRASVLGPGIAGLVIQGIESGLVFAQFSQWFFGSDHIDHSLSSAVIVFVTLIGFSQTGVCFASAWSRYVLHFGMPMIPDWSDYLQLIPTLLISVPVQVLMIRRCYYIVGRNLVIITPIVLLLVVSIVMSLWSTGLIIHFMRSINAKDPVPSLQGTGLSWPYLISMLLPSILDLMLTGILLHYLTRTMKQVYAPQTRKRISRFANIVWQSALPPTICAICLCVVYIRFVTGRQKSLQFWLTVIQAMIGKLYVLSLFYMINAQLLQPDRRPLAFTSTLTVPRESMYRYPRDTPGEDIMHSELSIVGLRGL
ncbi:hypothetical protein EI94DRAFT_241449 [Lactarius quietus]|nr:hypothetical protein EI94DRAFT_241449 [Lactarius quietus]